ncbi:hypothetical protein BESB_013300 [Besnoitia besnoiti]|uniref:Uncharacterized protein n=1 Tax=Besnoitia besnoiti TaxID=94643 RepID=A0A2A9M2J7_BESBE|nr:hypothetical protein BESB_013300 [Besnoitia besnoiti]PFH32718.1 hypothetical protein BESB_013300 [Besnoitia besnoiti]
MGRLSKLLTLGLRKSSSTSHDSSSSSQHAAGLASPSQFHSSFVPTSPFSRRFASLSPAPHPSLAPFHPPSSQAPSFRASPLRASSPPPPPPPPPARASRFASPFTRSRARAASTVTKSFFPPHLSDPQRLSAPRAAEARISQTDSKRVTFRSSSAPPSSAASPPAFLQTVSAGPASLHRPSASTSATPFAATRPHTTGARLPLGGAAAGAVRRVSGDFGRRTASSIPLRAKAPLVRRVSSGVAFAPEGPRGQLGGETRQTLWSEPLGPPEAQYSRLGRGWEQPFAAESEEDEKSTEQRREDFLRGHELGTVLRESGGVGALAATQRGSTLTEEREHEKGPPKKRGGVEKKHIRGSPFAWTRRVSSADKKEALSRAEQQPMPGTLERNETTWRDGGINRFISRDLQSFGPRAEEPRGLAASRDFFWQTENTAPPSADNAPHVAASHVYVQSSEARSRSIYLDKQGVKVVVEQRQQATFARRTSQQSSCSFASSTSSASVHPASPSVLQSGLPASPSSLFSQASRGPHLRTGSVTSSSSVFSRGITQQTSFAFPAPTVSARLEPTHAQSIFSSARSFSSAAGASTASETPAAAAAAEPAPPSNKASTAGEAQTKPPEKRKSYLSSFSFSPVFVTDARPPAAALSPKRAPSGPARSPAAVPPPGSAASDKLGGASSFPPSKPESLTQAACAGARRRVFAASRSSSSLGPAVAGRRPDGARRRHLGGGGARRRGGGRGSDSGDGLRRGSSREQVLNCYSFRKEEPDSALSGGGDPPLSSVLSLDSDTSSLISCHSLSSRSPSPAAQRPRSGPRVTAPAGGAASAFAAPSAKADKAKDASAPGLRRRFGSSASHQMPAGGDTSFTSSGDRPQNPPKVAASDEEDDGVAAARFDARSRGSAARPRHSMPQMPPPKAGGAAGSAGVSSGREDAVASGGSERLWRESGGAPARPGPAREAGDTTAKRELETFASEFLLSEEDDPRPPEFFRRPSRLHSDMQQGGRGASAGAESVGRRDSSASALARRHRHRYTSGEALRRHRSRGKTEEGGSGVPLVGAALGTASGAGAALSAGAAGVAAGPVGVAAATASGALSGAFSGAVIEAVMQRRHTSDEESEEARGRRRQAKHRDGRKEARTRHSKKKGDEEGLRKSLSRREPSTAAPARGRATYDEDAQRRGVSRGYSNIVSVHEGRLVGVAGAAKAAAKAAVEEQKEEEAAAAALSRGASRRHRDSADFGASASRLRSRGKDDSTADLSREGSEVHRKRDGSRRRRHGSSHYARQDSGRPSRVDTSPVRLGSRQHGSHALDYEAAHPPGLYSRLQRHRTLPSPLLHLPSSAPSIPALPGSSSFERDAGDRPVVVEEEEEDEEEPQVTQQASLEGEGRKSDLRELRAREKALQKLRKGLKREEERLAREAASDAREARQEAADLSDEARRLRLQEEALFLHNRDLNDQVDSLDVSLEVAEADKEERKPYSDASVHLFEDEERDAKREQEAGEQRVGTYTCDQPHGGKEEEDEDEGYQEDIPYSMLRPPVFEEGASHGASPPCLSQLRSLRGRREGGGVSGTRLSSRAVPCDCLHDTPLPPASRVSAPASHEGDCDELHEGGESGFLFPGVIACFRDASAPGGCAGRSAGLLHPPSPLLASLALAPPPPEAAATGFASCSSSDAGEETEESVGEEALRQLFRVDTKHGLFNRSFSLSGSRQTRRQPAGLSPQASGPAEANAAHGREASREASRSLTALGSASSWSKTKMFLSGAVSSRGGWRGSSPKPSLSFVDIPSSLSVQSFPSCENLRDFSFFSACSSNSAGLAAAGAAGGEGGGGAAGPSSPSSATEEAAAGLEPTGGLLRSYSEPAISSRAQTDCSNAEKREKDARPPPHSTAEGAPGASASDGGGAAGGCFCGGGAEGMSCAPPGVPLKQPPPLGRVRSTPVSALAARDSSRKSLRLRVHFDPELEELLRRKEEAEEERRARRARGEAPAEGEKDEPAFDWHQTRAKHPVSAKKNAKTEKEHEGRSANAPQREKMSFRRMGSGACGTLRSFVTRLRLGPQGEGNAKKDGAPNRAGDCAGEGAAATLAQQFAAACAAPEGEAGTKEGGNSNEESSAATADASTAEGESPEASATVVGA